MVATQPGKSIFSTVADWAQPFKDPQKLAGALRVSDSRAIAFVLRQSNFSVKKQARSLGIAPEKAVDFHHDGLIVLIEKMNNGSYDPTASAPATFLIGICKYLMLNHLRAKKEVRFEQLDEFFDPGDHDAAFFEQSKNWADMIDDLLLKLGPPCNDLIRLKYLDGFRDEEILTGQMTHFRSGDSLRNTRSQCMKKLTELAKTMAKTRS